MLAKTMRVDDVDNQDVPNQGTSQQPLLRRENPYIPAYRCCCGNLHTGTIVIGIIAMWVSLGGALGFIFSLPKTHIIPFLWIGSTYNLYWTISCFCLFYAIWKETPDMLLPFIVAQCLGMLLIAIIIAILMVAEFGTPIFIHKLHPKGKPEETERESEI
ncbi:hypothetical protein L596_016437 [Steinernema carpocapsae]|uniref:Uncharacterized protein n=1 Tax=Steinernema carpocapsae TaxID=34508 RepID=A0A4U5NHZ1_STECR|nr:hypothetical protein L596_016437 [Steinernema carpocapsae]